MEPKKQAYENMADGLIERFNMRGIEGYYCDNKEEALSTAKRLLMPGCAVSWGGSATLNEIGLLDYLRTSDFILYDREGAKTQEEKTELYSKIVTVDYFFMSSNAITIDGILVNIDGIGNRVACLAYGPQNVIIIAGMNKIVAGGLEEAIARVRNIATPANAARLDLKPPCTRIGRCADCLTADCICCQIEITRKSMIPNRIKVILVGEELGY